jgi:hypothetical protein
MASRGGVSVQSSAEISKQKRMRHVVCRGAILLLGVWAAVHSPQIYVFADSETPMKESVRKLADRIAAIPGLRGPLRLDWHPDEKWSEGEATRWQDRLQEEFDRRALPMSDDAAAVPLSVYAVATPTQVVLTAKTHVGERDEVRIVAIPRASLPPAELPIAPVRLERQLIYESAERILDASSLSNGAESGLAVLLYKNFEVVVLRVDAKGEVKQTVTLNASGLKPVRDPHAEIAPHGGQVTAQLWGQACDFSWVSPAEAKCHAEKAPASGKSIWRGNTLLTSPCDEGNWTISQPSSDATVRDVLHLVPDGATQGGSADVPSEFPGPVLSVNGEQNPSSALVVARNLRTGNYEVYKITLACGN